MQTHDHHRVHRRAGLVLACLLAAGAPVFLSLRAEDVPGSVTDDEARRVAVIGKVTPAVVAIFSKNGQGGGSGVLISKDGYALTNFHVVEGAGPVMKCGLPDGVFHDAVLVGLDKVGDVALIKLFPREKGRDFPAAVLGDSDTVRAGDWSLALGNPFLLATDFTPTVTFGLVSGVHRYQYPSGSLLEYTDCIQIDTSINPGNSGGPLFNMDGELIGINGRGSFDKRQRINSGVGYAITINQIKNFLGQLRAGIDTDHATLGAGIESEAEEGGGNKLVVRSVIESSDAHRRGLEGGDELVSFAGRPMTSVNQYKNVLGLYPKGWRVPLVYRRDNVKHEVLVRLMQSLPQSALEGGRPRPQKKPIQIQPVPDSVAAKFYQPKRGFANFYFNKLASDRLLTEFRKQGDFSNVAGVWTIEADAATGQKQQAARIVIGDEDERAARDKSAARKPSYFLKPELLPALPEPDAKEESPLRQSVRRSAELLRKRASAFPQEVWARDTDALLQEHVATLQKEVAAAHKELRDALEELKKAGKERDQETSRLWQAQYDYTLGRLTAFRAYVNEYRHLLQQLAGSEPPKRDPKRHQGWRMLTQEKPASGAEADRLAAEADALWSKMIKDYEGTVWAEHAQAARKELLGLKWQPASSTRTVVRLTLGKTYELDPLMVDQDPQKLKEPAGSGGLLTALYQYRHFLIHGHQGFEGHFSHGGQEPIYPPPQDDKQPASLKDLRVDTEVLATEHAAVPAKWFFSLKDHTLLGFEVTIDKEEDPCEVYLFDYRMVEGRLLPHRWEVRYGNHHYGTFLVKSYQLR